MVSVNNPTSVRRNLNTPLPNEIAEGRFAIEEQENESSVVSNEGQSPKKSTKSKSEFSFNYVEQQNSVMFVNLKKSDLNKFEELN
jgi:hypothetical protein